MFENDEQAVVDGATMLGFGSIGIGLMELLAPQKVQAMLGVDDCPTNRGILQVLGVREVMHGVGLLTASGDKSRLSTGLWARVAGDVLDTALLGVAGTKTKRPGSFAAVAAIVSAIGLADVCCAMKAARL